MKTPSELKNELLNALEYVIDGPLATVGFARSKRSLVYKRRLNDAEQTITFTIHCHPKYQPGVEVHIYPSLQIAMSRVSDVALALVKGDTMLLAGAPENIIAQPIDFAAPKDKHERWFATGKEQFVSSCDSIKSFLFSWVLPFLENVSTPEDLVRLYETNDARVMQAKHWHIRIAAAYQVLGQPDKTLEIVKQHFGSPGLRKIYAPLLASVGIV